MEELHPRWSEGDGIYARLGTGGCVSGRESCRLIRKWAGPVLSSMVVMKMLPEQ